MLNHDYTGTLNIYDLSDEIFVSPTTLKREIQTIRKEMKKFDLDLVSKADEIEVIGSEKNKRKMLCSIIYKESGVNFVNLQAIQTLFPDIDILFIKDTISSVFDHEKYFTNDYCMMNFVLHIAIAVDRIKRGNTGDGEIADQKILNSPEYRIAKTIAQKLEEQFHIHYSEEEICYMVFLILSRATAIDYTNVAFTDLQEVIGKEYMDIVNKVTSEICNAYYVNLDNPDFITRFALHIKNLTVRCKNNHCNKNPFTQEMKNSCPLIYDIALHATLLLQNMLNISINDDETTYIAFHLGSALEEQKNLNSKVTAVLYCPDYYDVRLKLSNKVKRLTSERLIIIGVITDESEIGYIKNADMIISTIAISGITQIPFIHFPYFSSFKDEEQLTALVANIEHQKRKNEFESYLRQLITPDLIEVTNAFHKQNEVLHYMVNKFINLDYVSTEFENEILERESLSPTVFGNFAIPHSMKMNAKKTGINVILTKTPIDWNGKPVQLILMMCFNKNERQIFNEIYEPLTMTLSDPDNVKQIITCKNYEEFINKVVTLSIND